ncbi:flagellin [sulfur-oxidizing endosymbiont of Gigantopelta aegis]|uniref:flagellin N-terminal helical domain-containing protein n=1 Tax=sulfur-oxidizing endosymbiont of Gigantopelta aegis TaxID=2794934 RepID=UPI0018DD5149|nr:flagellin [sulfur-oxidizing endosymbiont of Gigantopelta aegis]
MAIGINNSKFIGNQIGKHDNNLATSFARLASGKQINSAKDNAAGLAIVERFAAQILGTNQGFRNVNDGISLAQTADGASSQISDLIQRGRELAVQSGNGILNDSDRAALQAEFSMVQDEVKRLTNSAEFNGQKLLNTNADLSFQVDANAGDQVTISTVNLDSSFTDNGFFTADLSTQNGAANALASLDSSLTDVNTSRAEFGATINRFESIGRNLLNKDENLSAAKSRILDTDYARTVSERNRDLLLRDAATALQSQANFSQQQILGLL